MRNRSTLLCLSVAILTIPATADLVSLQSSRHGTLYETDGAPLANGLGQHLFAGVTNQNFRRRGLLDFDLSPLSGQSVEILSVTLRLHMSQSGAGPEAIGLHRMLTDWGVGSTDAGGGEGGGGPATPGSATWTHAFWDTSPWQTAGGDFATLASASTAVDGVGWYDWSDSGLISDVEGMLAGELDELGWMLLGNESTNGTTKRFDSMYLGNEEFRPQMIVEYAAVPAPGVLAVFGLAGIRRRNRRA
ncbi:MAG: DNRLRE domain-containing protein [Phycisphaerales bacterium]|nr:DNRLRE domain-containing protein [Phycisphaerales bacterium]